jgi:pilus assembly protein CpaB
VKSRIKDRPSVTRYLWKVKCMKTARILVLVVAVGAGGLAAFLASRTEKAAPVAAPVAVDSVDVLVAAGDIGIGQAMGSADVKWQAWPASAANSSFIRRNDKPDAVNELTGSIVRTPFVAGEPIREAKLIKSNGSGFMAAILPAGMRAISTEISAETGAGGFILPNDRVDVILSRRDKEAEKAAGVDVLTSEIILPNVRVLAIDQTVQEKDGQRVVVGKTATLELSPRQSETLALSRQLGTLTLALRSIADANAPTAEAPTEGRTAGRRGSITMVRFGVTTTTTPK